MKTRLIHELIEMQVHQRPDAIALKLENKSMTYLQLHHRSNQMACLIMSMSIPNESLIGVCLDRSFDLILTLLAILKAGHTYVPLEPNYPQKRLSHIINDSDIRLVITNEDLWCIESTECIFLDNKETKKSIYSNPVCDIQLDHLPKNAYVIYTSGTTGVPKGVLISHKNVLALLDSTREKFNFDVNDVWTMYHSYSFDFSVWEIFGSLSFGSKLVIVPYWIARTPLNFLKLLVKENVTVLSQTPSAFYNLISVYKSETGLKLRYVILGGEAVNIQTLVPWLKSKGSNEPHLINMYGITETTVHCTYHEVSLNDEANSHGGSIIGTPLPNMDILILDENKKILDQGAKGEIYVGGVGVAQGYLNNQVLTNERFTTIAGKGYELYYRSGDIGFYNEDNILVYLGRVDSQVNINGFRIELEEVERTLLSGECKKNLSVAVEKLKKNNLRLIVYVEKGTQNDVIKLRKVAKQYLPLHMRPNFFYSIQKFPLNINGKIDKKKLAQLDLKTISSASTKQEANNETENTLVSMWSKLLQVPQDQIGTNDHFIELGGGSITVIQMIHGLSKHFGINLDAKTIYQNPTIKKLDQVIRSLNTERLNKSQELSTDLTCTISASQLRVLEGWNKTKKTNLENKIDFLICIKKRVDVSLPLIRELLNRHEVFKLFYNLQDNVMVMNSRRDFIDSHVIDLTMVVQTWDEYISKSETFYLEFKTEKTELYKVICWGEGPLSYFRFVISHMIFDGYSKQLFLQEINDCMDKPERLIHEPIGFFQRAIALLEKGNPITRDITESFLKKMTFDETKERKIMSKNGKDGKNENLSSISFSIELSDANLSTDSTNRSIVILAYSVFAMSVLFDIELVNCCLVGAGRMHFDDINDALTLGQLSFHYPYIVRDIITLESIVNELKQSLKEAAKVGFLADQVENIRVDGLKNFDLYFNFMPNFDTKFSYINEISNRLPPPEKLESDAGLKGLGLIVQDKGCSLTCTLYYNAVRVERDQAMEYIKKIKLLIVGSNA